MDQRSGSTAHPCTWHELFSPLGWGRCAQGRDTLARPLLLEERCPGGSKRADIGSMDKATKQRRDQQTEAMHNALDPLIGPEAVNKFPELIRKQSIIKIEATFTLVTTAAIFGILYLLSGFSYFYVPIIWAAWWSCVTMRAIVRWYRIGQQLPRLAVAYFASTHGVSPDSVSVPDVTILATLAECSQWYEANVSAIRSSAISDTVISAPKESPDPSPAPPSPPAGCYTDPRNPSGLRFWDGEAWTDHVHP